MDEDGDIIYWSASLSRGKSRAPIGTLSYVEGGRVYQGEVVKGFARSGQNVSLTYRGFTDIPGEYVVATIEVRDSREAAGVPRSVNVPIPF